MNAIRKEFLQWSAGLYTQRRVLRWEVNKDIVKDVVLPFAAVNMIGSEVLGHNNILSDSIYGVVGILVGTICCSTYILGRFDYNPSRIVKIDNLIKSLAEDNIPTIRSDYEAVSPSLSSYPTVFKDFVARRSLKRWIKLYENKILRDEAPVSDLEILADDFKLPPSVSRVVYLEDVTPPKTTNN